MRVALVRPPTFIDHRTYPLNIEYIAAVLKNVGHEVTFYDMEIYAYNYINNCYKTSVFNKIRHKWDIKSYVRDYSEQVNKLFANDVIWDHIADKILSSNPALIGFSCYTASMSSTVRIVASLRKKSKEVPIILGGIHPTSAPKETLEKVAGSNFIVIGEGEHTIVELAGMIESGSNLFEKVDGICYRDKTGNIFITQPRKLINNLDNLPILNWEYASDDYNGYVILSSRGCPFNCLFCSSKVIWSRHTRYRSGSHVAQEIKNLVRASGVKKIRIGDDTFTLNKKHMFNIFKELRNEKVKNISFSVGSRVDTLDDEKIEIMKEYVSSISFGIESGSQRISDMNEKNIKISNVVPKIFQANEAGFNTTTFFIINNPTETEDDFKKTVELVKKLGKCKKNILGVNIGFPYPGTPWYSYCESHGLIKNIDYYNKSHQYNHQAHPSVNMTSEPIDTLHKFILMLDRIESRQNIRVRLGRLIKRVIKDPKYVLKKLIN